MKKTELLKITMGKIEWWEREQRFWELMKERGKFVNPYTGEVGTSFDAEQIELTNTSIEKAIKRLEYYNGIREALECLLG
jgi:hypothetical protein